MNEGNEADDGNEDDTVEFHFGLTLHDRVVFYASFKYLDVNQCFPGVNQARVLQAPAVLVKYLEQHTQNRIH